MLLIVLLTFGVFSLLFAFIFEIVYLSMIGGGITAIFFWMLLERIRLWKWHMKKKYYEEIGNLNWKRVCAMTEELDSRKSSGTVEVK